jgi:hypothetical protein
VAATKIANLKSGRSQLLCFQAGHLLAGHGLGLFAVVEYYECSEEWSALAKTQPREAMAIVNDHLESPAILIEQLDRDVKGKRR